MPRELLVAGTRIADDTDAFMIAEIGHNHQGNIEKCKELFDAAKDAGASAVKLQKRDNKALYTHGFYEQAYNSENSFGPTYGAHREALEFGWDEYQELKQYAKELDIIFFATAFDIPSTDFLAELDVPAIKIASGDLKSLPLLTYIAQLQKPMFLSTGAGALDDVRRAYETIMPVNPQLCLLQCTAAYPPDFAELDLRVVAQYRELFPDIVVGFSGHDSGISMATVAYALGARVIEKHFTLNRTMKGTDHAFSLEPVGFRKLVRDVERLRLALGDGQKKHYPSETAAGIKMGKKLVARHDLAVGSVLTAGDVSMKSPGDGISPDRLSEVLGRQITQSLQADEAITQEVLL